MSHKDDQHIVRHEWWRGAVIYQIYPRSFFDTTGNGVGDLPGITRKLDYLEALGVEGVWISPFFKSPMNDHGYDISDYREVDPLFGSNDDFRTLIDEAHARNIKIIADMVISHTSNEHPWFHESRRDRDNPKADWYLWADPKPDGTVPNNWLGRFGGPAWTFDPRREQYYYHGFLESQPDLNLQNPEVQDAVLAEMKYWLDFGVDGFRLDVCNHYMQDPELRNNPVREHPHGGRWEEPYIMQQHVYDRSRPENVKFLERIRKLADDYDDRFLVGEVGDDNDVELSADYASGNERLHTCYCFPMLRSEDYEPDTFRKPIEEFAEHTDSGWPSWTFSNHDAIRPATRWGNGNALDPAFNRQMLALLFTLRGTLFLYQGQELGLPQTHIPYDQMQDPWGKSLFPIWDGRDGARTPMPWCEKPGTAGFTEGKPWLPIPDEHIELSVEVQEEAQDSALNFTRRFLEWRHSCPILLYGEIIFEDADEPFLVFHREGDEEPLWAAFNLSGEDASLPADILPASTCEDIVPQNQRPQEKDGKLVFPPYGFLLHRDG